MVNGVGEALKMVNDAADEIEALRAQNNALRIFLKRARIKNKG